MPRFRKKPLVVLASQWLGHNFYELHAELGLSQHRSGISRSGTELFVSNIQGSLIAKPGDYVVKGLKGDLYIMAQDVFAMTYTPEPDETDVAVLPSESKIV